jgi:hypothetical protein
MMIAQENERLLRERFPDVWAAVQLAPLPADVALSRTQNPTLIIEGVHLTSAINRTAEAVMQTQHIAPKAEHVTVYGVAFGDVPRLLLRRHDLLRLTVVVMSCSVFRQTCQLVPHDWLKDPRVRVVLGKDAELSLPFAAIPSCMRLADESAYRIRDIVTGKLNEQFQNLCLKGQSEFERKHFDDNRIYLDTDPHVKELFNTAQKPMAIVVGGGPSLASHYDWIKSQDATLITASTVLKPLQQHGIDPAIVLAIDPHPFMVRHFESADLVRAKDAALVYVPSVTTKILELWRGPRYLAHIFGDGSPTADLFSGGTVVHAATDLAVRMGFSEICFAGVDFCHPGEKAHVEGAPHTHTIPTSRWRPRTVNGNGESVTTYSVLAQFHRELENYIARVPEVRFSKIGRAGVPLEGCTWMD